MLKNRTQCKNRLLRLLIFVQWPQHFIWPQLGLVNILLVAEEICPLVLGNLDSRRLKALCADDIIQIINMFNINRLRWTLLNASITKTAFSINVVRQLSNWYFMYSPAFIITVSACKKGLSNFGKGRGINKTFYKSKVNIIVHYVLIQWLFK